MNTSITAFAPMWIRCSAWPALQLATPSFVVLLLLSAIVFGPNALTLEAFADLIEESSVVGPTLVLLWSLALAPAARLALTAPGLSYLRWLPAPRWLAPAHLLLLLLLLHLPLPIAVLAAGKPAQGIAFLGFGLGLSACQLLPSYSRLESVLTLALGSALLVLLYLQHYEVGAVLGLASTLLIIPRQLERAASPSRRPVRALAFGNRRRGLLLFQLLRLWRCEATTLFRTLVLTALGMAAMQLVASANQEDKLQAVAQATLVATTPELALVSTILSLALRRGQEELCWLRLSLGVSTSQLRRSSLLLLLVSMLVIALLLTGVVTTRSGISPSELAALAALQSVHAISWAMLASQLSYRAAGKGREQSPAIFALCMALANMLLLGLAGSWVLWAEAAVALWIASRILGAEVNQELGRA